MWSALSYLSKERKSTVILSTRQIDEAKTIFTRVGIMNKGGNFKGIGSPQHLSSKFGTGFELQIKF